MRKFILLSSLAFFALPAFAGSGIPADFKAYTGNYIGYGSLSGAKEPSCSLQISEQNLEGRKTIMFKLVDNDRATSFLADAGYLNKQMLQGKDQPLTLNIDSGELAAVPSYKGCITTSLVSISIWTKNVEGGGGVKLLDGDLNYVTVNRGYDCGPFNGGGQSYVCGRLVKQ